MSWINRLESVNVEAKPEYRDFNVNARFSISGHPEVKNNVQKMLGKIMPLITTPLKLSAGEIVGFKYG